MKSWRIASEHSSAKVMAVVWDRGDIKVRDACARLASTVAYNTVKTAMERLFKKGLLTRSKVSRAFVYQATVTEDELEGGGGTDRSISVSPIRTANAGGPVSV